MSRSDQFMGLTSEAEDYLEKNEITPETCPHCGSYLAEEREIIGHYSGMFGDEYPLHRHELTDGTTADTFLQASPWDSGPMFFLGLRVGSKEFLWDKDEIEELSR